MPEHRPPLGANARQARELAATWLQTRPRDPRGFPVPWLNRWGAETAKTCRVSWDGNVGRPAVFHDDHGDTVDFTAMNMQRQRESMVRGLCSVCGRPVPWSRRNLVLSGVSVEEVQVAGAGLVPAVIEPWLDDRCAAIATTLCPALIGRRHDEDLHVVPIRRAKDVQLIVSIGRLDIDAMPADGAHPDHLARLAAAAQRPVAMWVKAVLLTHPIGFRNKTNKAPADNPAGASQIGHASV